MKIFTCLLILFLFLGASPLWAVSRAGCFWAGVGDVFVPGLGHMVTGNWDRGLVLGGARWITAIKTIEATEDPDFIEENDQIYVQDTTTDAEGNEVERTRVYFNKPTWDYYFYGGVYGNLTLISMADLYRSGCKDSSEVYGLMLAPLRVDHWGLKWQFWVPILALAAASQSEGDGSIVEFHLDGVSESRLRRDSHGLYTLVGIGEEMFFRGFLQDALWQWYGGGNGARHGAIFSTAALFGLAHTGEGFSANAASAFAFGVYMGYVARPSVEEEDMITAIAIHSWWDVLVAAYIYNHSDFFENSPQAQVPLAYLQFSF